MTTTSTTTTTLAPTTTAAATTTSTTLLPITLPPTTLVAPLPLAPAQQDCPVTVRFRSAISIAFSAATGELSGRVRSPAVKCERRRTVKVLDARTDKVVRRTRTDRRGRWSAEGFGDVDGKVYAKAVKEVFSQRDGDRIVCQSDRSKTLAI